MVNKLFSTKIISKVDKICSYHLYIALNIMKYTN